jgi:hypothetical protein
LKKALGVFSNGFLDGAKLCFWLDNLYERRPQFDLPRWPQTIFAIGLPFDAPFLDLVAILSQVPKTLSNLPH